MTRHGRCSRHEAVAFVLACATLIAALVGGFGCVPPPFVRDYSSQARLPKKPGQETAEALIQQELEGLTGWHPPAGWRWPEVQWVEGPALTCYGEGWYAYWPRRADGGCKLGSPVDAAPPQGPGVTSGPACQVCLLGQSIFTENLIQANWAPDRLPIHQTSLVHEYCHFFELWATGSGDGEHTGNCYTGARWVDLVNRQLQSAGL
jgi:hypothetical protein